MKFLHFEFSIYEINLA